DNLFGSPVPRRCLAGKNVGAWHRWHITILDQTQIGMYDVQHIQQLPFVLMDALDLYITESGGVQDHPPGLLNHPRHLDFVGMLGDYEPHLEGSILSIGL